MTDRIPPRIRAYTYRVAAAGIPLLVAAGVVSGGQAQLWLGLAAAVLGVGGTGLAAAHTPTAPKGGA